MRRVKCFLGLVVVLGLCLCFFGEAGAHTMWINSSDYSPEVYPKFGARTKVFFGYGHKYPVDDFLPQDSLAEFNLIAPDGGKLGWPIKKLAPNSGGFLATQVNLRSKGGYIVSAALKPGFYTMHMDKGKIHHKLGPKTGLKGVILSLYYEQYAKSLINAGETKDEAFSKPVGHTLELVPLKNPYLLKGCGGHFLPVQVLFKGKPAKFCKVYATYNGFSTKDDFACAVSADGEGIARIRLTHWGPWLIKADMRRPAPEDLKDKCNQLHYTATLTFEVP